MDGHMSDLFGSCVNMVRFSGLRIPNENSNHNGDRKYP